MRTAYHTSASAWLDALRHAALLALLFLAVACGDRGTAPEHASVAAVRVEPAHLNLSEGDARPLVAIALDAAGRVLTGRGVSWMTNDAAVAAVSEGGLVTAVALGSARISATIEGKTAESRVNVTPATVERVELSPNALTMSEGESRLLVALAKDANGRVLQRLVAWSSSDPTVVTVDSVGRLTAVRIGRADVTATVEGPSAAAAITVNRVPVAAIEISPSGLVLEVGEVRQMRAVLKDALGNVLTGRTVRWELDNGNATITATGLLRAVHRGYVSIIATSEGVSAAVGGTVIDAVYDHDLVYHREGAAGSSELFLLPLGSGLAPAPLNAGNARSPSPSPDGARIAFAVYVDSAGGVVDDIFVVDRSGRNMKRLTVSEGRDDQPAWSPNGGRIAFRHQDAGVRSDIWIMREDGTGQYGLTGDMPPTAYRSAPSWNRDGSRIAFAQVEHGPAGTRGSIWIMGADGSNKQQVTNPQAGFDATPSWSNDGKRIAFVRYYGVEADIAIVDVTSGTVQRIPLPGAQATPAWSPDGSLIAFAQRDGSITNIYTMQPNGTRVRLRTVDPTWGGGFAPAWINKP